MENKSIAIDGPSGAGKSTLARMIAAEFGLIYVDTGAIYRSVGLFTLRNNVDPKDHEAVAKLLPLINIELKHIGGIQHMFLNGEDVSDEIRLPQVSIYASDVSAIPDVRRFLLGMQRSMAVKHNVIMDGRDIGTVVLPNAGLKVFLTATPEERARRRLLELQAKNVDTTFEEVLKDIIYRDTNDSNRKESPLKQADDAILVDTSDIDLQESFRLLCSIIRDKIEI